MIRTFYPVGQGAFYSERHEDINIVYDCGSKSAKIRVDKKVENAFSNEVIDILFISHYDDDHVNKIDLLLKTNTIKIVVLPLLQEFERILLYNLYVTLGLVQIARLLNNPNDLFSENTKVIYISPNEASNENNNENSITLKELELEDEIILDSYIKIKINEFWEYIPYNHSFNTRNEEFLTLLELNKIDLDELKADINYGLKNKKIIREIYKQVSGNINENSLILYSGPTENTRSYIDNPHESHDFFWNYLDKAACIFTGDTNFNVVDIKSAFLAKWNLVGTVQIPHHGSKKDFNEDFLQDHPVICPISFGNDNTFGHPHIRAIESITKNKSIPKLITENAETLYIQIIKYTR
jgi:beta-lactamase superfamily II metal-dependent hydrolase